MKKLLYLCIENDFLLCILGCYFFLFYTIHCFISSSVRVGPKITFEPHRDKTNKMAQSAQSDQSLRCALNGELRILAFFKRTAKTLIRLGECPG